MFGYYLCVKCMFLLDRSKGGGRVSRGHGHSALEEPMQASAPPRKKTAANHKVRELRLLSHFFTAHLLLMV